MTIPASFGRRNSIRGCLCCLVVFTGCGRQNTLESLPTRNVAPYITANEFSLRVSNAELPVLVEFSVPAGCYRCDQMRGPIVKITKDLECRVDVCRLDLNFERDLVTQLGIRACPTYVAFDQGKEVFRVAYPTSGEMLAARLEEIAQAP